MTEAGRLQKALETTMAAGYQIDVEGFDYLSTLSATDDPEAVMNRALQKIEALQEKPMFIGRSFLEQIFQEPELPRAEIGELHQQRTEPVTPQSKETQEAAIPAVFSPNRAYAKGVESQIDVLEDPTGKLSSNGTMEEFMAYFQDRFKRIEKLLRQRMDVKAATPIAEALKSQPRTKLKIIGMVTEKRDAKQQLLITLEDLHASATVWCP